MSWGEDLGATMHDHLRTAYLSGDILFLAAVPNATGGQQGPPASWDEVVGVGDVGLYDDYQGSLLYRDLSGYSNGVTIRPICGYADQYYCHSSDTTMKVSGTSPATAVVAGIAGLLRAYRPWESADRIRWRLMSTATGSLKTVDAFAALRATPPPPPPPPLMASIGGPSTVKPGATCSWHAVASGGTPPSTYTWTRDGISVGNGDRYDGPAADVSFALRVYVRDSAGGEESPQVTVATLSSAPVCPSLEE
jgi:hypothetical protein